MKLDGQTVFPEKKIKLILINLLCLMPLIGMAVDLVAPSLPAIAKTLHVPNSLSKNIITTYLLGYGLGNFLFGFLTDAYGRKKLMRATLLGFVIASLLPALFPNIRILLLARFLQGLSIGGSALVARAIFSDILSPEKLVRMGVLIGTIWGLGPIVGPVIGGYLQFYFGWQAGFWFFSILSFLLSISIFITIPETHFSRHPLNIQTIRKNLKEIFTHRLFMCLAILMGIAYSLIIVFNTIGPFLIQNSLNYSSIFFGHLGLLLGFCFLIATIVCRYLLKSYKAEQLLKVVIYLFLALATIMFFFSFIFPKNIILIGISSGLMFFACGFIFPMSMGKGISLFRHIAGTASATMYLINISITSLISFAVSFLLIYNAISLLLIYFSLLITATLIYGRMKN